MIGLLRFQSTHPRGVRQKILPGPAICRCFNPRTHEGCDLWLRRQWIMVKSFNPRTHEGCDTEQMQYLKSLALFQSTHPRGVRPIVALNDSVQKLFQSTHPRGVRLPCGHCVQCLQKFQSTHPRGVRLNQHSINSPLVKFQSTHPRGVRRLLTCSKYYCVGFNPRTHEGCDQQSQEAVNTSLVSIHAPTRGATDVS